MSRPLPPLQVVATIRSRLKHRAGAPRQGTEGAPDAWLEVHRAFAPALEGIAAGDDRPNPIGLHRVTVRRIAGARLRVGPIEAIDGTPVLDLKPVLAPQDR